MYAAAVMVYCSLQQHCVHTQPSICILHFHIYECIYSASPKKSLLNFSDIFTKRLGIFSQNFISLLYVPIYDGHIFIQLPATLTKLCRIKRDNHHMFKMSTMCSRNARWVVALNMA